MYCYIVDKSNSDLVFFYIIDFVLSLKLFIVIFSCYEFLLQLCSLWSKEDNVCSSSLFTLLCEQQYALARTHTHKKVCMVVGMSHHPPRSFFFFQ